MLTQDDPIQITDSEEAGRLTSRQFRRPAVTVPIWMSIQNTIESHLPAITIVWICGVFGFSFYRLFGFVQLHVMIRSMKEPIDALWEKRIRIWIRRLDIRRRVRILQSDRLNAPAVYGWLKPVLLIPASFLTGLDAQSVESIVIHELAHIRRHDFFVNMIQVLIETLGFFHPAVWWLSNRIRRERENCCDDWAVRMLGDKLIYVKSLVRLEEARRVPPPAMAANGSELSRRITRILDFKAAKYSSAALYTFVLSLSLVSLLLFTGFTGFQSGQKAQSDLTRLREHVIASYPFSGNAMDASGSGLHGKVKGATLTHDRFGHANEAYAFNGKNNLIFVPADIRLHTPESVTVSCWIKPERAASYASWVSMGFLGANRSQWRAGFGQDGNAEWGFTETVAADNQKAWFDFLVTDCRIPLNEWTHVTTVANKESGDIVMYKNGRPAGRIRGLQPFHVYKTELYMGYQPDNPEFYQGALDEVRIFDTALTDDEVKAIYQLK